MISTTRNGIFVINQNGFIDAANMAAAHLFGYTVEQIRRKILPQLLPQLFHNETELPEMLPKMALAEEIVETVGHRQDSSVFPVAVQISQVYSHTGHIFIISAKSIDEETSNEDKFSLSDSSQEREKTQNELLELQQLLEREREFNHFQSRFISVASHEFRSPLSAILGSADLIARYTSELQQPQRQVNVNRIKSGVYQLTELLDDFSLVQKLQQNKVLPQPTRFDVKNLIQQLIAKYSLLKKSGQEIIHTHHGDTTEFQLDKAAFTKIVAVLLKNALIYSNENQQIRISTAVEGKHLTLILEDSGWGIPPDEQPKIFDCFYRASNVLHTKGIGLGLTIVKAYMALWSGDIQVKSDLQQGTRFLLRIPLAEDAVNN